MHQRKPFSIDPKVDCVFKALLGNEENQDLLIHFLNSVLGLKHEQIIRSVQPENSELAKEYIDAKEPVVDVINWARIYSNRFLKGQDYGELKPVISIWLLGENLFPKIPYCHETFELRSRDGTVLLSQQCAIHIFQLRKVNDNDKIESDKDKWLHFFKEGDKLSPQDLPDWMQTPEMRKAMEVLEHFYFDEAARNLYESSLTHQRVATTMRNELNAAKTLAEKQKARADEQQALAKSEAMARESAEIRNARLLEWINEKGLNPPDFSDR